MSQKNIVDWKNRQIIGKSGKVYKIEPENVSAGRWREYEIQSLMLSFNSDFKTYYTSLVEIHTQINQIKVLGDAIKINDKVKELIAGIGNYAERPEPKIIKFCSLFCNAEGEEVGEWSELMAAEKYEDWKDIPVHFFFQLAAEAAPLFKEVYQKWKESPIREEYQTLKT